MTQATGNETLSAFIKHLTGSPGVYKMLDDRERVLYVGKASNLKKRVSSYFNKAQSSSKTLSLVGQITSIEVIVTETETEALLLESTLIKALHPKYNVLLRDDKSYPYIQISRHDFPRLDSYRAKKKPQKGLYFGPFPSNILVKETVNLLQKVFKIRNCKDPFFNARTRPCLQYQINRCTAPCVNWITKKDYQQSVEDAVKFLQGKSKFILKELSQRMEEAANRLAFEEAATIRDQIKNLSALQERQRMVHLHGDADVIVLQVEGSLSAVLCVTVREGQVLASQSFFPILPKEQLSKDDIEEQVLEAFISHYYLDLPAHIPKRILFDKPYSNLATIQNLLTRIRKKTCHISVNPRGKNAGWVNFAKANLKQIVEQQLSKAENRALRFEALRAVLQLQNPISRMECFDISHTGGQATVASCVVFDKDGPRKSDYRQFNIQNITPGDDYAAMEQAVLRRYKRLLEEKKELPDLLIIDGGKGQITATEKALRTLNLNSMNLIGIAKGVERKPGLERLILVRQNRELSLPSDSNALHLLQQIRDEAHRFAVKNHRNKRAKEALISSLNVIEGIGPKRKQALLRHFGGLQGIKQATIEEIAEVEGISLALARKIFEECK